MRPKDDYRIANSVDLERSSLIWVYIVCLDLFVRKLRIITVYVFLIVFLFYFIWGRNRTPIPNAKKVANFRNLLEKEKTNG